YLPVEQLEGPIDEHLLNAASDAHALDADVLYRRHIKGVYSDLLSFMGRMHLPQDEAHQAFWMSCQVVSLQLVDAVKDAKHLQKNLRHYLRQEESVARTSYAELRRHLLETLRELRALHRAELPETLWRERMQWLDQNAADFDGEFRKRLFMAVRSKQLDGLQTSSLMNDLGYASRIFQSLRNALLLGESEELARLLRNEEDLEEPLLLGIWLGQAPWSAPMERYPALPVMIRYFCISSSLLSTLLTSSGMQSTGHTCWHWGSSEWPTHSVHRFGSMT